MSYLTAGAEQALIGAMLADQELPAELEHLRAEDFAHRVLRDAYTAIIDLRDLVPTDRLPDAVATRLIDHPGADAAWLRQLRDDACPEPAHVAAYARMVQVAAFRRDVARHGERIAQTMADSTHDNPEHLHRLAAALTRQAEVFQAFTSLDERDATHIARHTTQGAIALGGDRAAREDLLIADLLAHPEQAVDVARVVPPETFTSQQRREIFMTIVTLAADQQPIDDVIVLWEFERLRAAADRYGGDLTYRGDEFGAEPNAAYLNRLAHTAVIAGTAITIGHQLVVEDTRAQLRNAAIARVSAPQPSTVARRPLDPTLQPPAPSRNGHQPQVRP